MKVIQQSDNSFVLNPQKEKEKELKCAEFTLSEDESFEDLRRTSDILSRTKTIASLSESDIRKANEVIRDVFMLITKVEGIIEQILAGDYSATEKIVLLSILKSWNKIAKYCKGIAMVTINTGIKGTVESEF